MQLFKNLFGKPALTFKERRDLINRSRARYGYERSTAPIITLADKINGLMAYNSLKQA